MVDFAARNVFPHATEVTAEGHLSIGGCDVVDLAVEHGTPLYVFDEQTIRDRCQSYRREFQSR